METSLANMAKPVSTKNTKISQAWWHAPVMLATQEAEAGQSLEHGWQRLQRAEITPLQSSLGDRASLRLKKKRKYLLSTESYTCNCIKMPNLGLYSLDINSEY